MKKQNTPLYENLATVIVESHTLETWTVRRYVNVCHVLFTIYELFAYIPPKIHTISYIDGCLQ